MKLIFLKTITIYQKKFTLLIFFLSSFFWHQLQNVLAMHARTISNGDVKTDLRRIGI